MKRYLLNEGKLRAFLKNHNEDKVERISDGAGLIFEARKSGTPRWLFRYTRPDGRKNEIALGLHPTLGIAKAREKAEELRVKLLDGIDPAQKISVVIPKCPSFTSMLQEFLDSREWSEKHRSDVIGKLKHIPKFIQAMPLDAITPRMLMENVFLPLQQANKLETCKKVRIIISQVFRHGIALGDIYHDPARDLQSALKSPVRKHFAAVTTIEDLRTVWQAITTYSHVSVRCALQVAALTFQRPFNIRAMEWEELDLGKSLWVIPAAKMKMRVTKKDGAPPHVVPLSEHAKEIIAAIPKIPDSPYCFPGRRSKASPISDAAMSAALRALDIPADVMSPHGFRSTASTLLNASGLFSSDAIERQLAHVNKDRVRAAYDRGDYMEERVRMMQWWGELLRSFD